MSAPAVSDGQKLLWNQRPPLLLMLALGCGDHKGVSGLVRTEVFHQGVFLSDD
jgi:hypothetical protein